MGGVVAIAALGVWIFLLAARGGFWRASEREARDVAPPGQWPAVAAIIPARDEAETVGACVASLLSQDYPGPFDIVLVDDASSDGTAAAARAAGDQRRLTILTGRPLAPGWTGKLWALKQGLDHVAAREPAPALLLLTDADIVYAPGALRDLVAGAQAQDLVLNSLMAKLRCRSLVEAAFAPAFVFFFQMLYPFGWVNDSARVLAAGAGGCMLARADALREAGGIEAVASELIDDCALARRLKRQGPIRLALAERVESARPYARLGDFSRMVTRSAYTQLGRSPVALAGTILAMAVTFLGAPLAGLLAAGWPQVLGAAAWALMAVAYQPMLRYYRLSPLWGLALPAVAFVFMIWTVESALQHARGRGGAWKGRIQSRCPRTP